MFSMFARPALRSVRLAPVIFSSALLYRRPCVFNDVAVAAPAPRYAPPEVRTSRFGGKLDYGELSIGSVTGLFLGIIVGKLSSAIVFLSLSSYLLLQFLENRGIITIPWTSVLRLGNRRWDLKTLFFNKPSFKISFVASFLIAAFNV